MTERYEQTDQVSHVQAVHAKYCGCVDPPSHRLIAQAPAMLAFIKRIATSKPAFISEPFDMYADAEELIEDRKSVV